MVQYSPGLDAGFGAVADPTRRGILEYLGYGDGASISDLAGRFDITLTGMKKHVQILERSGLVTTRKVGRVRTCTLGPRRLEDEIAWITRYREMLDARLDRLGKFLERTKGDNDERTDERDRQGEDHHARRPRNPSRARVRRTS